MASATYSSPMAGPYVEIKVAAMALRARRPARRLDSFAVLLRRRGAARDDGEWEELARTETVQSDASPAFVESFEVPLLHHHHDDAGARKNRTELVVAIFQKTSRSDELRKNSLLGHATFSLAKMLKDEFGTLQLPLEGSSVMFRPPAGRNSASSSLFAYSYYSRSSSSSMTSSALSSSSLEDLQSSHKSSSRRGTVVLCGERVVPHRPAHMYHVRLRLDAHSQAWGSRGSDSSPSSVFYVLYRAIPGSDAVYTPVYRSEVVHPFTARKAAGSFRTATIRAERLVGMNEHRPLRVEFFHHCRTGGAHLPIGFVQMSASSFKYAKPGGKLFVVPNRASGLANARVIVDTATMSKETRRATLASDFTMRATGFVWGVGLYDQAQAPSDYLDRDETGRAAVTAAEGTPLRAARKPIPRGVSYMSLLASRVGSSVNSEDTDSSPPK